jgi:hypothetical protein
MNKKVEYVALTLFFAPCRWCCYGMLWIGTAFAIATVSVCDFHRATVQTDDDRAIALAGPTAEYSATVGLYCFRVEFLGKVFQKRYSELDEADETDETEADESSDDVDDASHKAAQSFGVLAAIFIPLALILYHVAFFVKLPNRAVAKGIWWTIRILAMAAVVSVSLTFIYYYGVVAFCLSDKVDCRVGPGAILAGINAIMNIILTVCLFLAGPPQAPFRCGMCNWSEDNGSVRRANEEEKSPVGSDMHGAVQTTTTEEVMEDGRRSITTETVDAYGNKTIVKRIAAAGRDML